MSTKHTTTMLELVMPTQGWFADRDELERCNQIQQRIESALPGVLEWVNSGTGFSQRDTEWVIAESADAQDVLHRARAAVSVAGLPVVHLHVVTVDDDDDGEERHA